MDLASSSMALASVLLYGRHPKSWLSCSGKEMGPIASLIPYERTCQISSINQWSIHSNSCKFLFYMSNKSIFTSTFQFFSSKFGQILVRRSKFVKVSAFLRQNFGFQLKTLFFRVKICQNFSKKVEVCQNFSFSGQYFGFQLKIRTNFS